MSTEKTSAGGQEPHEGEIILYTTPEVVTKVEVFFQDETFWLTQKQIAALFDADIRTISEHLQKIFESGELHQDLVLRKIRNTAADGKKYLTNFYNPDAIIAVGYRVNSLKATQFRIWATQTLREFIIKEFARIRIFAHRGEINWQLLGMPFGISFKFFLNLAYLFATGLPSADIWATL